MLGLEKTPARFINIPPGTNLRTAAEETKTIDDNDEKDIAVLAPFGMRGERWGMIWFSCYIGM